MSKCCHYIYKPDLKRYNSKLLRADERKASLFCDYWYTSIEKDEYQLIKCRLKMVIIFQP